MALPLHLGPAAAAIFDHLPERVPSAVADRAVAAMERARAHLARAVPPGTELVVDAYRVRLAAGCPASAAGGDDTFRWTPATVARHLGLRALALHLCGDRPQPVEQAVEAVLAEQIHSGGPRSPGPWLASLDPPGRAVAQAQARRWAEQAAAWLPLRLVGRRSLHFLDDDWWTARPPRAPARPGPDHARTEATEADPGGRTTGTARPTTADAPPEPGGCGTSGDTRARSTTSGGAVRHRTLVLHGRRDVTVEVGGRRVAVTVAGGTATSPGAVDADALTALAATLADARGRVVRVVRVHPASGEVVATDVTAALLDRGVAVALATAAALAAGPEVPTTPGPGCTWCDRQQECAPGTAWLRRPDRRSMGLPLRLTGASLGLAAPEG